MDHETKTLSCCFFGHRQIDETPALIERLTKTVETLITGKEVTYFYFGSKSQFDSLCLKTVTALKEKYPHIKRIYVRSAFPDISESYKKYLLQFYEETYFPEKMRGAGKASYVERNQEMIQKTDFCVVYYDENYAPPKSKSGTAIAFDYAVKKKKKIINVLN